MSKRKSAEAKKELEQVEVDIEGVFGIEDPGPEEEEEEDGLQGKEEEAATEEAPEEVEPKYKETAEETEVPETVAEETAPTEEKIREKVVAEREQHEKGLLQEVMRLRSELKAKEAERQAPMPLQPQTPQTPSPQYPSEPVFNAEFEVGDDGKLKLTPESASEYERYTRSIVEQRVAAATRVDPRVQLEQTIESETQRWVQADPQNIPARYTAAQRMRQAQENMEVMIEHHAMTTQQRPENVSEWLQAMEMSGTGQQFRQAYPEISDMYSFVDTFFSPTTLNNRIDRVRRYMDFHMLGQSTGESAGQTAGNSLPGGQRSSPSNVVPLSTDRPRSMAQKGRGMEAGTSEKEEFERLDEELGEDPIGLRDGSREKIERYKYLAKKLDVEM